MPKLIVPPEIQRFINSLADTFGLAADAHESCDCKGEWTVYVRGVKVHPAATEPFAAWKATVDLNHVPPRCDLDPCVVLLDLLQKSFGGEFMKEITTTMKVICDGCKSFIDGADGSGRIGDLDLCIVCLKTAFLEYKRIVEKEVPDRRGGFRQLGMYDG